MSSNVQLLNSTAFPAKPGQIFDQGQGRYEVVRKVGAGASFSMLLVKRLPRNESQLSGSENAAAASAEETEDAVEEQDEDEEMNEDENENDDEEMDEDEEDEKVPTIQYYDQWAEYLVAKVFDVEATQKYQKGELQEVKTLETLRDAEDADDFLELLDKFEVPSPRGSHLCLITNVVGTDATTFRLSNPKKVVLPYIVKEIINGIVPPLKELHELGIAHTNVQPNNVLFNVYDDDVERYLNESLATDGEYELDGEKYPILRSQPVPHKWKWNDKAFDAELITVTLAGLGKARTVDSTLDQLDVAPQLRAPEIILKTGFGDALDIWQLGLLAFELLVGRPLFSATNDEELLAQMMEYTGEVFSESFLAKSPVRDQYFDKDGNLLKKPNLRPTAIEVILDKAKVLPPAEVASAAAFIEACLRLDPAERAGAEKLEVHPWLLHSGCSHYD